MCKAGEEGKTHYHVRRAHCCGYHDIVLGGLRLLLPSSWGGIQLCAMEVSNGFPVVFYGSGHVSASLFHQSDFVLTMIRIGLLYLPDSPRWLLMRGREVEARHLLARLADAPVNSEEVDTELSNIKDALAAQSAGGCFQMCELFQNGPSQNLRRTLLGIAAQFFQQISGINLIVLHTPLHNSSSMIHTNV